MNKRQPLISVILPVYNVELYIKECMDSILNQTVQDFEIIVIDDCSTDSTLKQIEIYDDVRIKIIQKKENKGLIDSLNIGFELAEGKYIARMDGDDINELFRFEKQLAILENNPDIIVCSSWVKHFGDKNKVLNYKEFHDEIVSEMLIYCSLCFCASMMKRDAIKSFKFNIQSKHVEDYDFLSRIAWVGKFYNIQKVLYHYRVHEMQVSSIYNKIQKQGDIPIQLFLFKKIGYNSTKYSDDLISKMILLDKPIKITEFSLFLKWLNELTFLNMGLKIYSQKELENILKETKRKLLFKIYFKKTNIGITRKWRIIGLFVLNLKDILKILLFKSKEFRKSKFKK